MGPGGARAESLHCRLSPAVTDAVCVSGGHGRCARDRAEADWSMTGRSADQGILQLDSRDSSGRSVRYPRRDWPLRASQVGRLMWD